MNSAKVFSGGLLLLSAGCLTPPGELGVAGGSSGSGTGGTTLIEPGETEGDTTPAETTGVLPTTGESSGEETAGEGSTGEPVGPPQCGVDSGLQRRLTSTQLENAIADLFDVSVDVQLDDASVPFESAESLSPEDSTALALIAATVAAEFAVPACFGEEAACAQEFLNTSVPLVLRGKVSVEAFMPIYEDAGEYQAGIRAVVEAMILHPAFADLTPTGSEAGGVITLDARSFATRLALLVWNSVPSAGLLGAGEVLLEPGSVEAALDSMMSDPRFARAQADLYTSMTGVRSLLSVDRSNAYEGWSEAVGAAMVEEQWRFVASEAGQPGATLEDLLTSSSTFVNAELATLYGVDLQTPPPSGDGWAPGELDPTRRAGLLTQTGMISVGSYNRSPQGYPAPSGRGESIFSTFMCFRLPASPPVQGELSEGIETRADWEEAVLEVQTCEVCHRFVDPLGFPLGDYDSVGRWDPRGDATNAEHPNLDEEFADVLELGELLAADDDVHNCMAERYYTFALRRTLGELDRCAVEAYAAEFSESGGELRVLVEAIATSESFRLARP